MISSSIPQSSYEPSGRNLLTIIGIFLAINSLPAIFKGSVSPSISTLTGAPFASCSARVPSTRAFSNRVMKGEVCLFLSESRDSAGRNQNFLTLRAFLQFLLQIHHYIHRQTF